MAQSLRFIRFIRRLRSIIQLNDHVDVATASDSIRRAIYFRGPNVFILFFAIIIASLGLNVNSIPVIIGAMLVSPLMGPIMGLGLGFGTNDMALVKEALKNLVVMVTISIVASSLYFVLSPLQLSNPTELLARTNPTIYDVLIALFGGFAGILETTRKEKGTVLSGVAIATALMPPLCTIGYGVSQLNLHYILGALYLFFINSVFIALATFISVKYLHFPGVQLADPIKQRKQTRILTILVIVVIVPSILTAVGLVRQNNFARNVDRFIEENKMVGKGYIYDYKIDNSSRKAQVELYFAGEPLSESETKMLYLSGEKYGITSNQIVFHSQTLHAGDPQQDLVKSLVESTELKLQRRDDTIAALQKELKAYRDSELPSAQLSREISTQYPDVQRVTVAQGNQVSAEGSDAQWQILVMVKVQRPLPERERAQMEQWLRVRLQNNHLTVIAVTR